MLDGGSAPHVDSIEHGGRIATILLLEERDRWIWVPLGWRVKELREAISLGKDCELELELETIEAVEKFHGVKARCECLNIGSTPWGHSVDVGGSVGAHWAIVVSIEHEGGMSSIVGMGRRLAVVCI
jgi:hypothetical protein